MGNKRNFRDWITVNHQEPLVMEGQLTLFFGPMGSGKTASLLHALAKYHDLGYTVSLLHPRCNTRELEWHSSIPIEFPDYLAVSQVDHLEELVATTSQVIGIDEAQFFDDLDLKVPQWVNEGKLVFVAGLDADYLGNPMGKIHSLIHLADKVKKKKAVCRVCLRSKIHKNAIFTKRTTGETDTVLIGGFDKYEPVCRYHFLSNIQ